MATALKQPEPAYGSLAWVREMIANGATEKSIVPVLITPLVAAQMLLLNTKNRNIKPKKVEQFRRALAAGLWRGMNGETIKFKRDGTLGDGQHRLTAIAAEATDVMIYVMFGADDADIDTIDQGSARTAGDVVRLSGGDFAMERAAVARLLIAYEESGGASIARTSSVSNAEIIARVSSDDRIRSASEYASRKGVRAPGLPGSAVAFCWYLFGGKHLEDAETYLAQVCTGVNLKPRAPAMTVRDYLIRRVKNGNRARDKKIEAVMRGFVAFREGREFSTVVTNGTLPELV